MSQAVPDRDLLSLFDASWASTDAGLEGYMQSILENCVQRFSASGVSLFLKQDLTGDYLLATQSGPESKVPDGTKLQLQNGIAGICIAEQRPMLVNDPHDRPTLFGKVKRRNELGTAMIVPLITPESGTIGVLNVSRKAGDPAFTDLDLNYAGSLARHVGLAISNARLFMRLNAAVNQTRALNERLDAIIACLGVGVLVVDDHGEITAANPEARVLFGYHTEERRWLEDLAHNVPDDLATATLSAFVCANDGERASFRAVDSQQDKAWSVVGSPLPRGGATIAVQEVSEHERAQREFDRVRRLAEIGQMTAAVAHEIRNPLTGIRSAAQMVQTMGEEPAMVGKIIEEEALKLNSLCDQFLDFAKPLSLHVKDIELEQLTRLVAEQYAAEFQQRGVSLKLEIEPGAPTIKGDPLRVEQVLRNLMLNALQACGANGFVTVKVLPDRLCVEDDGKGMEAEQLEKLFTPFFTTKSYGTGLGLTTVRKIVDAHGWQIRVESHPGRGTKFEVAFEDSKAA